MSLWLGFFCLCLAIRSPGMWHLAYPVETLSLGPALWNSGEEYFQFIAHRLLLAYAATSLLY